jgi:hypothetical protein
MPAKIMAMRAVSNLRLILSGMFVPSYRNAWGGDACRPACNCCEDECERRGPRPAGSCITAKAALAALAGKNHFIDPVQAAADQIRASAIAVAYMPRPKTEWPITLLRRVTLGLGVLEPAIPIPIPGIIMK